MNQSQQIMEMLGEAAKFQLYDNPKEPRDRYTLVVGSGKNKSFYSFSTGFIGDAADGIKVNASTGKKADVESAPEPVQRWVKKTVEDA